MDNLLSKQASKQAVILCLSIFIVIVCVIIIGVKFYKHEMAQNNKIEELLQRVNILESKIDSKVIKWSDGYNYLAIGNSITIHPECEYWWDSDRGMAASSDEKDFVHIIAENKKAMIYAYNFSMWETNGNDRAEFLPMLDNYLSKEIDLITIQLGENAAISATWQKDFVELIKYIQQRTNAKIIVIGDFWYLEGRDYGKKEAAALCEVDYINIEDLQNEKYYVGMNSTVLDHVGNKHVVEHDGVAKHPNDEAMRIIAERVIEVTK